MLTLIGIIYEQTETHITVYGNDEHLYRFEIGNWLTHENVRISFVGELVRYVYDGHYAWLEMFEIEDYPKYMQPSGKQKC